MKKNPKKGENQLKIWGKFADVFDRRGEMRWKESAVYAEGTRDNVKFRGRREGNK